MFKFLSRLTDYIGDTAHDIVHRFYIPGYIPNEDIKKWPGTKTVGGITYRLPSVYLINESGIGVPEVAARTAYDSFDKSDDEQVSTFKQGSKYVFNSNEVKDTSLLSKLSWTYHHQSVLEHATLSFYIEGTSRGTLQEHVRHRHQAITVRSTRYTMTDLLLAFWFVRENQNRCPDNVCSERNIFVEFRSILVDMLGIFIVTTDLVLDIEVDRIYRILEMQKDLNGYDYLSKDHLRFIEEWGDKDFTIGMYESLRKCKTKRNAGDNYKILVTDNWAVDMVITFNLSSLKNYFKLRDSGSAYFQIRWLAEGMKEATPKKYLELVHKNYKVNAL